MQQQAIDDLIERADSVVSPRTIDGRISGDVGCALSTRGGNVYLGVCIDTGSGTGFCAEHSAIAAMVTRGETEIASIVAVWRDEAGTVVVLAPCGRCREFIRQISPGNLDTDVVVARDTVVRLRELLPFHAWPG
jgi:cytidine deaminase